MKLLAEPTEYLSFLSLYTRVRLGRWFGGFESRKDRLVDGLVRERGRLVRPFIHSGVVGLVFVGVTLGPTIVSQSVESKSADSGRGGPEPLSLVLGMSSAADGGELVAQTQISEKPRAEIVEYSVQNGDTVGTIASKFGVSEDTIYWENNITAKTLLKPGQTLKILPVTGVKHVVARGETVQSIAKKYDAASQAIADWPFNTFVNDETFELAVGQTLMVPDGVKPNEVQISPRQFIARQTPDAGTIAASGSWVWPAQGRITQQFVWYHPGLDIANKEGPVVVAADSGKVISVLSYNYGYGNHVIVDHGNGFTTLYAHLANFRVQQGQTIAKGAPIGVMGSTGRSTGTHLHFEIRQNGKALSPLNYLK